MKFQVPGVAQLNSAYHECDIYNRSANAQENFELIVILIYRLLFYVMRFLKAMK